MVDYSDRGEIIQRQGAIIVNTGGNPVGVDAATRAMTTIDYSHHEIHAGSHFFCRGFVDVINAGTYYMIFETPDTTKWIHFFPELEFESEMKLTFYIHAVVSPTWTELICFNNNGNVADTAGFKIYHNPEGAVAIGTQVFQNQLGSGKNVGGQARTDDELVLKQNTVYLLLVENETTGAANLFNYDYKWYEYTNKTD